MRTVSFRRAAAAALIAGAASALGAGSASAALVYGLDVDNNLFTFDSAAPTAALSGTFVSGLAQNENLIGIDFRLANNQLYGLGSANNLYTINTTTGAATLVGAGIGIALSGTSYGFDVNPRVDRMRIVSDTDQNLRVNMDTGALASNDPTLKYIAGDPNFGKNPSVVGAGYTNNFTGGTGTQLFVIDSVQDVLALQNPANDGVLTTIGSLGVDATNLTGFDIFGFGNVAYAALQTGDSGVSEFYTIDLATGAATRLDTIAGGLFVRDIAVQIVPEPGTAMLLAAGLVGLAHAGRRRTS